MIIINSFNSIFTKNFDFFDKTFDKKFLHVFFLNYLVKKDYIRSDMILKKNFTASFDNMFCPVFFIRFIFI